MVELSTSHVNQSRMLDMSVGVLDEVIEDTRSRLNVSMKHSKARLDSSCIALNKGRHDNPSLVAIKESSGMLCLRKL